MGSLICGTRSPALTHEGNSKTFVSRIDKGCAVKAVLKNDLRFASTSDEDEAASLARRALGMDDLNRKIIAKLQEDGRLPFATISRELETSEGTVRNRVNQMIKAKVLRIIAVADPLALGNEGYAMVAMRLSGGADPRVVSKRFEACDEVTYILFAAGRYDLLVEVISSSHRDLRRFLLEHCYGQPDIASVEPLMALAMYKSLLKWGRP